MWAGNSWIIKNPGFLVQVKGKKPVIYEGFRELKK
jgi:hypothetical protein